jgi:hypothetical protein
MPSSPLRLALLCGLLALSACSKSDPHAGHDHSAPSSATPTKHEHQAPHGGTPVVLGREAYHLELVREAATGKLSVYVLDGEMENFIRVAAPSLELVATVAGAKQTLTLTAVANPATGEKVGDTALFEVQADWLKSTATFDATLTSLTIRGTAFTAVPFNFPKGNDKD